jgi:hypothetical protein
MGATARDFNRSFRVLTTLAAIFFVVGHGAPASGMGAFLLFSLSHGEYPFFGKEGERLEVALPDFGTPA